MNTSFHAHTTGRQAEEIACHYLLDKGLKLLEQNYRCRGGEIDLIMQHDYSIVFVEVRYRRNNRYGSGAESVIRPKQQKMIATALHYLQSHSKTSRSATRFDVISIHGETGNANIEWIRDAFQA